MILQHSVSEIILKIGLLVFEFIHYKQKYKSFLIDNGKDKLFRVINKLTSLAMISTKLPGSLQILWRKNSSFEEILE